MTISAGACRLVKRSRTSYHRLDIIWKYIPVKARKFAVELSSEVLTPFRDPEIPRVARAIRAKKLNPLSDAISFLPSSSLVSLFVRRHTLTDLTPVSVSAER